MYFLAASVLSHSSLFSLLSLVSYYCLFCFIVCVLHICLLIIYFFYLNLETKSRSLEDMDAIFGGASASHDAEIMAQVQREVAAEPVPGVSKV